MPGNNRQRVARPFGRRFVNSEVTHAFTTGKFSIRCRGTSPATYPSRLLSRSFQHRLTSVGEHSTGAVHQRPFPIADLCFEATPQPLRALAPADILSARCTLRVAWQEVSPVFRHRLYSCCFAPNLLSGRSQTQGRPRDPGACGQVAREPATAARVIVRSPGGVEPPLAERLPK
jgi:hypothetical protein